MATTSVVDSKIKVNGQTINNVVIAGTKVYRVVANGHISFDRKDYSLSVINYTHSVPVTGGPITVPDLVVTSLYTGYTDDNIKVEAADADYSISPSTISSNAHNTSPRTGTITVTQDNSQLTGTFSYRQAADSYEETNVCTSITVTLTNVPVIPASGGSVNSCTVTAVANGYVRYDWQSGGSTVGPSTSWTMASSEYTVAWTGVTASSKGTTPSQQTTAGTLSCKVTYRADTSKTATKTATVYQAANQVTGYTSWEYEMSVSTNVSGTYPAAGGTITVSYSGKRKRKPVYSSNATGSTYSYADIGCDLTSNYGSIAAQSVTGAGSTTLTLGANGGNNRTVTITLAYQDDSSKKATTSFTQYGSSASFAYAYLSNYTGNGQLTTWSQIRGIAQDINAASWTSPTQSVYSVTADGTVKYRLGSSATAALVPADTYFYNNSSLLFNTRNVTSAGAEGTEHLWYKNNNWSFGCTTSGNIPAANTSFVLTGSTNTSYGVTVKEGTTTKASTANFNGSLTVNCGANTSTSSTRTFTVTFTENNSGAENKPTMSTITITQDKKVAGVISLSSNEWYYYVGDPDTYTITVNATSNWKATFPGYYFYVNPSVGNAGATSVTITARRRAPQSVGDQEIKFALNDDADVYDILTVIYEE